MIRQLYVAAATWAGLGLAGGLYYRTLTHAQDFTDGMSTQLAPVHTHALVLGCLWMLVLLALVKAFALEQSARLRQFFVAWQIGLVITIGSMVYKGSMQVLGNIEAADSKALAGISGMGHIILTVAMILLFMGLKEVLATRTPAAERLPAAADA